MAKIKWLAAMAVFLVGQEAGFARPGTPDTKWGVGAHAFRCVTKGKDVFIFGANAQATGYGVYAFGERKFVEQ